MHTNDPAEHKNDGTLRPLADELGVTVESLARLGVTRTGREWHIPERNADGEIIGTAIRNDDGRKWFVEGGHRGLTMAWPIDPYAGSSPNAPIIVVEGMSDTATGLDLGYVTIGRPSACGGLDHLLALLKDRHVVIVGENDSAGRTGVTKIADGLAEVAVSVRVVFPPDNVKDLRAWRAAGCDHDELRSALTAAPLHKSTQADNQRGRTSLAHEPVMVCMADVQPQPIQWLWQDRVALGKLTLIAGDPGLGKSMLTLDIAARTSRGGGWPDQPGERFGPGGVVLLSAEDDAADTIRPRLDAAGADVTKINILQAVKHHDSDTGADQTHPFCLTSDLPALESAIQQTPDCRLVVVDPISAYLAGTDSHKNAEVRALLHPLADLAAQHGLAIVAVTHLTKGEGKAVYRAMGSLAFTAAARAVWAVCKDADDPTGRRRLFLSVKMNLSPDATGLAYTVEENGLDGAPAITWAAEPVSISAEEAMARSHRKPEDGSAVDGAADWLREALADGPIAADMLERMAKQAGHCWGTVKRAKKSVGAQSRKDGFGEDGEWYWWPPGQSGATTPPPETLRPLVKVAPLRPDDHENSGDCTAKGAQNPKGAQTPGMGLFGDDADNDWGEL